MATEMLQQVKQSFGMHHAGNWAKRLGLRIPVISAPMFLVSGPELVVAACKAGIVGAFPTPNARPIEMLDHWMQCITQELSLAREHQDPETIGPWCTNVVTHSSNTRLQEDLHLIAKYKPPIVVTALGSPKPVIETVHAYGGIVIADVTNMKLAEKAIAAGADGLACICAGAGGHTGQLSPFAFISAVRAIFNGYVITGGAISDGWGIAGAIAAGADLVYMGTRFISTTESMAEPEYKQMLVNATSEDLLVSTAITGSHASWLKPSLIANGIDPDQMPASPPRSYDSNNDLKTRRWKNVWTAGQGVGRIKAVEPIATVVDQLEDEWNQARARFCAFAA